MAARTAVRGLSTNELQTIRDTLAAGRKPKVVFTDSAGQIAGQFGQVVRLTDPTMSDDWVVVRFGGDELPFSPTDLSIPPRGATVRRPSEPKPTPELKITQSPVPAPREETTVTKSTNPTSTGGPAVATVPAPAGPPLPPPAAPAVEQAAPARGQKRAGAGKARPKGPAGLTVTLAYADGEWTVGAVQGSKPLAKPYVIKPAEALKMVSMLDVPGVHEAVEQIVAVERAEAQAQADRLRAELAEIEERLAELREAG